MPEREIEDLFEALSAHDVLPILLSDSSEQSRIPTGVCFSFAISRPAGAASWP